MAHLITQKLRYCITALTLALLASTSAHSAIVQHARFAGNFSDLFFEVDYTKNSGKSEAAARAKAQHGGKVLSVSESTDNGTKIYKVKLLLNSGRIKIVKIKGNSQ